MQCHNTTEIYDLPVSEVRSSKRVLRGENPGIDKAVFLSRTSRGRLFLSFPASRDCPLPCWWFTSILKASNGQPGLSQPAPSYTDFLPSTSSFKEPW